MTAGVVAIVVVVLSVAAIVFFVLTPWRSPRRDALDEEEYLALLAGEEPLDDADARAEDDDDESGPSAGDVAIP